MQDMKSWLIEFIRHKDVYTKSIQDIKDQGCDVLVTYKNKKMLFVIQAELEGAIEKLDDSLTIVTLNSRKNLNVLVKNWPLFVKFPELTVYFINPESENEKKWVIRPNIHDKIADDDYLKQGLSGLFETVDVVKV